MLTDKDYLHGNCDVWVNNNFRYNDTIIAFIEYDYEIDSCALLHCCLYRNGQYLDIRGELNTIDDVLDDFDYGDFVTLEFSDLDSFKEFLNDMENGKIYPEDIGL